MKLKIPWRKVAATAWEWAQIIWKAKHPTDKPPTPPVVPALLLVAALATLAPPYGHRTGGADSLRATCADAAQSAGPLSHSTAGACVGAHL